MRASPDPGALPHGRVLVRGVNWLGDAVMTTPALQRLREALPAAHITLLTQEKLADLWQGHPSLDSVMTFSRGESPWSVARRLRTERFDAALVLPNSPRSALEVWLARIPQRIGYARPWCSWLLTRPLGPRPGKVEMPRRSVREVKRLVRVRGTTTPVAAPRQPDRAAHQIYDYLHLVATLGANPAPLPPRLEVSATELRAAEAAVAQKVGQASRLPQNATKTGVTPKGAGETPALLGLNPAPNTARPKGGLRRISPR